jgi:hypothetical protein
MEEHAFEKLGGKPRAVDTRDHVFEGSAVPYPATFMQQSAWDTFVHYQGHRPACGAHAAVHAKQILDANDGKTVKKTPRFTWADIKKNGADKNPSNGSDMYDILSSLKNTGADDFEPLENDVTYDDVAYADARYITQAMLDNAKLGSIDNYSFTNGPYTFEQIKSLIYQNKVVIALMSVGNTFWTAPNGQTSWKESDICPIRPPAQVIDGHFVVFHSYDENYIYFVNSFGPTWGRQGHGYIGPHYPPYISELGFPKNASIAPVVAQVVQDTSKALEQVQTLPVQAQQPFLERIKDILLALLPFLKG